MAPSRSARFALLLLTAAAPACSSSTTAALDAAIGGDAGVTTPDASLDDGGATADAGTSPDASAPPTCDPPASTEAGLVRTTHATLRGVARGSTWAYLGVPFAAPPVGALRFAPPAPPACETTVRDASAFGPLCPQLDRNDAYTGDEDCLYLNVWAPQDPPPAPRPVLFFIHGGGNNQGGSSVVVGTQPVYDGEALASRGNVVVTTNYRIGALGFLTHAALDAESPKGVSGNQGLRDQLAALAWVRDNIARFGGDPERVMVFGESAGGLNTCLLYVSPLARGLFSRALLESGGCGAPAKAVGLASTDQLAAAAGCSTAADVLGCLRAKTPAELIAALPADVNGLVAAPFGPIIDGDVLPRSVSEALAAGDHADVPFVLGTNADETAQMVPPAAQVSTQADFERIATAFLTGAGAPPAKIPSILAIYPLADYGGDAHAALVALTTDWRWGCAGRFILRTLAPTATAPLWRYYFTHALDRTQAPMLGRAGAYHSLELFYVFGSIRGITSYRATADDLELSDRMQRYWSRFAASGDPNASEDPAWPAWRPATDDHLRLDVPTVAGQGVRRAQCDALEAALR